MRHSTKIAKLGAGCRSCRKFLTPGQRYPVAEDGRFACSDECAMSETPQAGAVERRGVTLEPAAGPDPDGHCVRCGCEYEPETGPHPQVPTGIPHRG